MIQQDQLFVVCYKMILICNIMAESSHKNSFWLYIKRRHVVIFLSLTCLFLLLWNLDRYFPICPYGLIPFIVAIIMEVVIWGEH